MDEINLIEGSPSAGLEIEPGPLHVDSTQGSLLHCLRRRNRQSEESRSRVFFVMLAAVGVTYVPLLLLAAMGPLPIWTLSKTGLLPFLRDWNVMFMFLVSLPLFLALTLLDQAVLAEALESVQRDRIVLLPAEISAQLATVWERRFRSINRWAQWVGATVGLALAALNYAAYRPPQVGFWIALDGRLLAVGWMFLLCISVFYAVLSVYVIRSAAMSIFLRDLVRHAELRLLPAHPDHCGGLRPVGTLGLRNQYALTLVGVNVVLLVWVSSTHLLVGSYLHALIVSAAVAYLVLGPLVFVGPLLPFRGGMMRTKALLMSEVAQRLRVELMRIREQLRDGEISKSDEELIERLRKIGSVIDELPVWPFDAGTLRKFVTAYVVPILGAVAYALFSEAVEVWFLAIGS